jgi:hypothetical protein
VCLDEGNILFLCFKLIYTIFFDSELIAMALPFRILVIVLGTCRPIARVMFGQNGRNYGKLREEFKPRFLSSPTFESSFFK